MMIKINTSIFRWVEGGRETFVGMEYINDNEKVPVFIKYTFKAPVVYQDINFDEDNLHVRQLKNGEILCTLEKNISKKLFIDICNFSTNPENIKKTNNFILGYIYRTLGTINDKILKNKYEYGLFLVKPILIFDIYEIGVIDKKEDGGMAIWPVPHKINLGNIGEEIYNRDFIDAITSYLLFDFDDCIRKIITSLENFLKLDIEKINYSNFFSRIFKFNKNNKSFVSLLNNQLIKKNYFIESHNLQVIKNNLQYIYSLRCDIVHNKVRLNYKNKIICTKAIASACYALQNKSNESKMDNLLNLLMQSTSIDHFGLMDLDFLEKYLIKWRRKKIRGFDNKKDWKTIYLFTRFFDISSDLFSKEFTDALFNDLKITRSEKRLINRL